MDENSKFRILPQLNLLIGEAKAMLCQSARALKLDRTFQHRVKLSSLIACSSGIRTYPCGDA